MKPNCSWNPRLSAMLGICLFATGCSAQWINVALADLPVLLQMSLNIGTLVTTLQSGRQISPEESAAIQNISNEASKDLNLLQTLYNDYRANPSATTLQKIDSAVTTAEQNLPALLQAAHISDPALLARVRAGVNLILTTIEDFAALIPPSSGVQVHARTAGSKLAIAAPAELKRQWNERVCTDVACRVK